MAEFMPCGISLAAQGHVRIDQYGRSRPVGRKVCTANFFQWPEKDVACRYAENVEHVHPSLAVDIVDSVRMQGCTAGRGNQLGLRHKFSPLRRVRVDCDTCFLCRKYSANRSISSLSCRGKSLFMLRGLISVCA